MVGVLAVVVGGLWRHGLRADKGLCSQAIYNIRGCAWERGGGWNGSCPRTFDTG